VPVAPYFSRHFLYCVVKAGNLATVAALHCTLRPWTSQQLRSCICAVEDSPGKAWLLELSRN
jgi:hypothetical protein